MQVIDIGAAGAQFSDHLTAGDLLTFFDFECLVVSIGTEVGVIVFDDVRRESDGGSRPGVTSSPT